MITVNAVTVKDYLTKSKLPDADYVINPYIGCPHKCIYCYAEFMKRFTNHKETWGDFLDVKVCDKPVVQKIMENSTILIGSVTDAYNPFEKKYCVTQKILKQLVETKANVEILTKSNLVLRDINIFKKIPNLRIGISMNSLDDNFRKNTEPFASSINDRIFTLSELNKAGIDTYLFLSPIFPGITDFQEIVEATRSYSNAFYFENLNLRGAYLPRVLNFISENYVDLIPLYDEIYKCKNNLYWAQLAKKIESYCTAEDLKYKLYFYHKEIKKK